CSSSSASDASRSWYTGKVADDVGLVGRRVDNGGAIDFSISMTRRYPTSIRFGGGFRIDCATASRSVRLTFAGCDHRIGLPHRMPDDLDRIPVALAPRCNRH